MPDSVRVNKIKVLETLKSNKEMHHKEFEEAIEGWITKAQDNVTAILIELKANNARDVKLDIHLPKPISFEKEYEKAIKMIELEVRDEIDISKHDFERFFLDEWEWKDAFLSNTVMYKKALTF